MKTLRFLFAVVLYTCTTYAHSQELITQSVNVIEQPIDNILAARATVEYYQPIEIDLTQTLKPKVLLNFFDQHIEFDKVKIENRSPYIYSWFGSGDSGNNQAILTVKGTHVQGIVTIKSEVYRIQTLGNAYVIMKIDQSKFPAENCEHYEFPNYKWQNNDNIQNFEDYLPLKKDESLYKTYPEQEFWNFECKLRVLVLFTTAAKNAFSGDMEVLIHNAIDATNQSFANSNVNFKVELVFVGETGYTEVSSDKDVQNFQGSGDGHMDNVHLLREQHSADVCVLVNVDQSFCGSSPGIKVCSSHSFCSVDWSCAADNFSLAHEIGHIVGMRHDLFSDNSNIPYADAHGFIDPDEEWRTIMAVGAGCNGCPRLLFWSNPNITKDGQAMGTTSSSNATRVLNKYIPNVMTHRPSTGSWRMVIQSDIWAPVGVIYHQNHVESSGSVIIPNTHAWGFLAGNEITLDPGFETNLGSTFEAKLIPDCGLADGEPCNFSLVFDPKVSGTSTDTDFGVYPNPVNNNILNIKALNNNPTLDNTYVVIVSSLGHTIIKSRLTSSSSEIILPNISSGIYVVNFITDGKTIQSSKIIIP